jgi:hypothetical protein
MGTDKGSSESCRYTNTSAFRGSNHRHLGGTATILQIATASIVSDRTKKAEEFVEQTWERWAEKHLDQVRAWYKAYVLQSPYILKG